MCIGGVGLGKGCYGRIDEPLNKYRLIAEANLFCAESASLVEIENKLLHETRLRKKLINQTTK
jgi:hypothetical protein